MFSHLGMGRVETVEAGGRAFILAWTGDHGKPFLLLGVPGLDG